MRARYQARKLEALLDEKLTSFSENAADGQFEAAAEDFSRIEQLSKIVALDEEIAKRGPNLFPVLALAASLVIATVLVLARVPTVDASFDLSLAEVRFVTNEDVPLIGITRLEEVGVSGLTKVSPPLDVPSLNEVVAQSDSTLQVHFQSGGPLATDDITVPHIILPIGTEVSIVSTDRKLGYELKLDPARVVRGQSSQALAVEVQVRGRIRLTMPFLTSPTTIDFGAAPKKFSMEGGAERLNIDLYLRTPPAIEFYSQNIKNVVLRTTEQFSRGESLVLTRSSVLGGTIYLDSVGAQKIDLRPGEPISFDTVNYRLDSLRVSDGVISMKAHGTISNLCRGEFALGQSMMPTLLQWLVARQPLALLWGAALWLYGVSTSVWTWHRR